MLGDISPHNVSDFAHALVWIQFVDKRNGTIVKDLLVYIVVRIGKCCNLWQMRYTNYLVITGKSPQLLSHNLAASSTDTGVDFIEDERRGGICHREDGFQGQHEA